MGHTWQFFRAGGVDQVSLRDARDLRALPELDPKLWVALAMPTRAVDIDPDTLDLLDEDRDGRVRVPDILAAVAWVDAQWKDPGLVLTSADEVALDALQDGPLRTAAQRILRDVGK